MNRINEEKIIRAFKNKDNLFIHSLYKEYLPVINRYVCFNNGSEIDAKDLIQQAFLIILQKIRTNEFELTCSFKTYLYSICRNLWLKELRRRKIRNRADLDPDNIGNTEFLIDLEKEYIFTAQYFLYRWHFNNLSKICQKLLKMKFLKYSYFEIANELNFVNGEVARKKKYRCKELLVQRIINDPRYKEYIEYEK